MGNPYHDSELWRRVREARERWELACAQNTKAKNTFSVVVFGLLKSGKSTLCNALLGDLKNTTFPVGVVRETTVSSERQKGDSGITIVDTPGFGTDCKEDERWAKQELLRANVILFVHSMNIGDINDKERTMLEFIKATLPDVHDRVLIVCSKLGEFSEGAEEVLNMVKEQIEKIMGGGVNVVALDSLDYQAGMAEDDADLVEYSRFGSLLGWLEAHRDSPTMSQKILKTAAQDYENALKSVQRNAERNLEDLWTDRNRYRSTLQVCWSDNRSGIQRSWDKCARYSK